MNNTINKTNKIDEEQFLEDMNCDTRLHRTIITIYETTGTHLLINIPSMGSENFYYPIYRLDNFDAISRVEYLLTNKVNKELCESVYIFGKVNTGLYIFHISDLIIKDIEDSVYRENELLII